MSDDHLLNRPLNPKLQMTVQKGIEKPDNVYYGLRKESTEGTAVKPSFPHVDPTLIDHGEPSLWSMLSRLFRRKSKPHVRFIEHFDPYIMIETEYKGKMYQGVLYPLEDENK